MPTTGVAAATAAGVVGDVGGGDDGGAEPVLVAVPVGAPELVVADAEEDVLVDGADCVGVEDCFALVVGRAERVASGVFGAVPTVVPGGKPPNVVAGSEVVVGDVGHGHGDFAGAADLGAADYPANRAGGNAGRRQHRGMTLRCRVVWKSARHDTAAVAR